MNLKSKIDKKVRKGTIVFIQNQRKFGFIEAEDGENIFFHAIGVIKPQFGNLRLGNEVEYLECESDVEGKEKRAIAVKVI